MKTVCAHVYFDNPGYNSSAEVMVEGLGKVEIKNFLSDECKQRIANEAVIALQQRLGIVCNFSPEEV